MMKDRRVAGVFEQFDRYGAWRKEVGLRLKLLVDWLLEVDLLNAAAKERAERMLEQLRADRIVVAFVAEFSRGKSELINAVFFSGYGRRIMPASAGRTTMCPTELGYDDRLSPSLRLLPIDTHLQSRTLREWRSDTEAWTHLDLDVNDPAQLAGAMARVSETVLVSQEAARSLGFWNDDRPKDNPPLSEDGRVEVPRWRHALINMAHPLLMQGLVVLDTPGLNAIGAEPELTMHLIPQAHALVFVLAADAGVTKSDLVIWRDHLAPLSEGPEMRLAVLNKIDTLWDGLSTPAEIQQQIERQRQQAARILELDPSRVLALSAQKGLLAKVRSDRELLEQSQLLPFEQVLGQEMLGARQKLLERAILSGVELLQAQAQRMLGVRRRELFEQMQELRSLRGKNHSVIRQMRARIEQEKADFDRGTASAVAVRSVHTRLMREVFGLLSEQSIGAELAPLMEALRQPGLKVGIRKTYAQGFQGLRDIVQRMQALGTEIESMFAGTFKQLNAEHGFSLQLVPAPDLSQYPADLDLVEQGHIHYLGMGNMFRLSRPEFAERLGRAVAGRIRVVFDAALSEFELWSNALSAQLEAQLRERKQAFERRLAAIERIHEAAGGLDLRLKEIDDKEIALNVLDSRLARLVRELRQVRSGTSLPVESRKGASGSPS